MRRLLFVLPVFTVLIAVLAWLGCDDYNVVEPRFYSDDDVVAFGDCDGYRLYEPTGVVRDSDAGVLHKIIPTGYMVDGCWLDRSGRVLEVIAALPMGSRISVSILNSGGGIERVLYSGYKEAGLFAAPWVAEDDGVYAISLDTEQIDLVLWFEVE